MDHIFGPVLSRRLGLSMGVDLLPSKTCNMDCNYCEIGGTTRLTMCRERFFPERRILREIQAASRQEFDHLTFAGSGEPTLHLGLGEIIRSAKRFVDRPIAVITNSSLLSDEKVRSEVAEADLVLPSLDAATQPVFETVNRPAPGIRIEDIIEGLKAFRREYSGQIWLEVMLVRDVNVAEAPLIAKAAQEIEPDRIQLNTVVRPPPEPVLPLTQDEMLGMLDVFEGAEVIPDWDWRVPSDIESGIMDLLAEWRTVEEVGARLGLGMSDCMKYFKILELEGKVRRTSRDGRLYFSSSK